VLNFNVFFLLIKQLKGERERERKKIIYENFNITDLNIFNFYYVNFRNLRFLISSFKRKNDFFKFKIE
jgi:hypothetical protein